MDPQKLIDGLESALDIVSRLAPIAGEFGVPGAAAVGKIAQGAANLARLVEQRIADWKVVMTSDDEVTIRRLIGLIQAENDVLAAKVAQS